MVNIIKKFLELFLKFFKVIEENKQINIIQSISKDKNGFTMVFVSAIGTTEHYSIYPHEILKHNFLKDQFRPSDIKILESILITEGDVFVHSKQYCFASEQYNIGSVITKEVWELTESQLLQNANIYHRMNTRYFNKSTLNLKTTIN